MPATLSGECLALSNWLSDPTRSIVAHLAQNAIPVGHDSISLADLVECNFPGYAPVPLTDFTFADDGTDDYGEADTGEVEWQASGLTQPQAVTCVYLTLHDGNNPIVLWQVFQLPTQVIIELDKQAFLWRFLFASIPPFIPAAGAQDL